MQIWWQLTIFMLASCSAARTRTSKVAKSQGSSDSTRKQSINTQAEPTGEFPAGQVSASNRPKKHVYESCEERKIKEAETGCANLRLVSDCASWYETSDVEREGGVICKANGKFRACVPGDGVCRPLAKVQEDMKAETARNLQAQWAAYSEALDTQWKDDEAGYPIVVKGKGCNFCCADWEGGCTSGYSCYDDKNAESCLVCGHVKNMEYCIQSSLEESNGNRSEAPKPPPWSGRGDRLMLPIGWKWASRSDGYLS